MAGLRAQTVHVTDGLLGPTDLRRIAADLNVRPTKTRGQNFLHDANTIRRIVHTAGLEPGDVVLEVGPGLGSLTLGLLPVCRHVTAVEIDSVLADALPSIVDSRLPDLSNRLLVVTADALRLSAVPGPAPTALVANLPYNVAVPVLLHLLELLPGLRQALVMVQAEVAERLAAAPGSRIYGAPTVKIAWYADVRRAGSVSRQVFWPEPNVDSGLVLLTRRSPPPGIDRNRFFAVVEAAFAQRRKTLRAALAQLAGSPAAAESLLHRAGVDPRVRGESLDIDAYARITAAL